MYFITMYFYLHYLTNIDYLIYFAKENQQTFF